ncbi:aquaporin Z [soil metagenome]
MSTPTLQNRLGAEALGTFLLVFGGAGTAVFAGEAVGALGVALAFGLTVLAGAYAFGPVSGGHFNPAVTLGLVAAKRFDIKDAGGYIAAQIAGGIVAGAAILAIASGKDGFSVENGFATNGYGDHSPNGYNLLAVIIVEVVLTAVFLYVILGVSAKRAAVGFSGLAIGLTLTLIHLISIPVSNTSVNPARSIGTALFSGDWEIIGQQWVFIVAPIVGAVIAGVTHAFITGDDD